ncbi:MAG TPA: glycosyltransferase family 2 protein [Solirubrobacteraceae bacterium]|nr:glycosyltransferase family 2 protein [Solirubrobacteraceae bacterium]
MPRARISACLIVQDEQERLPAALASVAFCDEVIVVDGGSTDATVACARAAGARVIERPWRGFAIQRNVAIDAAGGDWILEVDADERVSAELRASIEALLAQPPEDVDIAVFALRNRFLGGRLGPSAKYPAYRSRLFRRGAYRHDESLAVHEGLELRERPLVLDGDLEHELADTLGEALRDTWRYARLESLHVAPPGTALGYLKGILARPLAKLAYRVIVEGGWRDGWRGLLKISLDAGSDALVWSFVLVRRGLATGGSDGLGRHGADGLGRHGDGADGLPEDGDGADGPSQPDAADPGHDQPDGHFGPRRAGPARIVAIADRGAPTRGAADWLEALRSRGIDVALVCPRPPAGVSVPCRAVAGMRPLAAIRALETERQLRIVDAVVPFGRRAGLLWRMLPRTLRPQIAGLRGGQDPERAAAAIAAAMRRPAGE